MKKLSSLLLTLVVLMSMTLTAFAASVSQTTSATTVEPGDTVTVTLTLDETLNGVAAFGYSLFFDSDVYTLKESANGTVHADMTLSNLIGNNEYRISVIDRDSVGMTLNAGTVYTLTFEANDAITTTTETSFKLVKDSVCDLTWQELVGNSDSTVNVTVKVETATPTPTPDTPTPTPDTPTPTPDTPTPTPDTPTPTPDTPTPTPDTPTPTPNVPSSTPAPTPDIPDTADNSTMMLWGAMMIASLAGAIVITKKKLSSN